MKVYIITCWSEDDDENEVCVLSAYTDREKARGKIVKMREEDSRNEQLICYSIKERNLL